MWRKVLEVMMELTKSDHLLVVDGELVRRPVGMGRRSCSKLPTTRATVTPSITMRWPVIMFC